jgi:hypothetical protein
VYLSSRLSKWNLEDGTLDSEEPRGLACRVDPQSLAQLYSSKTDDELLALAADKNSLFEDARPILASEIRRRNLLDIPPTDVKPPAPRLRDSTVGKFFRSVGEFLLNYVVAVIGTTMMESSIWSRIGHSHSVSEVLAREWLLGPTIAALLGVFVGRRWLPKSAPWVWILPAALFVFRTLLYETSSPSSVLAFKSFSGHFLAPNCLTDRIACTDFFVFTIPAARTASYSLTAWISLRFQRQSNNTDASRT